MSSSSSLCRSLPFFFFSVEKFPRLLSFDLVALVLEKPPVQPPKLQPLLLMERIRREKPVEFGRFFSLFTRFCVHPRWFCTKCMVGLRGWSLRMKAQTPLKIRGHLGPRYMYRKGSNKSPWNAKHKSKYWEFQKIHPPNGGADLVGISIVLWLNNHFKKSFSRQFYQHLPPTVPDIEFKKKSLWKL